MHMRSNDQKKRWRRDFRQVQMTKIGVPDFETLDECNDRQQAMLATLEDHVSSEALQAMQALQGCAEGQENAAPPCCINAACWFANRSYRAAVANGLTKLIAPLGGPTFLATIIRDAWVKPPLRLDEFDPASALQWAWRRLNKLDNVLGIIGVDVTFNVDGDDEAWAPHLHAIIHGVSKSELRRALQVTDCDTADKPLRIETSLCVGRSIAYVTKRYPGRRVLYLDRTDRHNRNLLPLKQEEQAKFDTWLFRQNVGDRFQLIGCRKNAEFIELIRRDDAEGDE